MLWGLISSVFVIYLYRTLNAQVGEAQDGVCSSATIDAALANLNKRIDAIESRVRPVSGEAAS